ncbi:Tyrosine-protein phosphatase [Rhodovastum atsumiense]|uniref:tyrosine-protein phosphatase n=1 Tax=Rhodovastum atsumiense TaxID=504468 RepID=UPI00139F2C0F|nr:tyrosine-protein phosphatase [Rhodovastum atsumiense]CAH2599432.1 Tyrosine-protein phosphatase [Rhodovastum atsumiense]
MSDHADLPRCLALEGVTNLRDLGGWPVAGGGRVRFGQVFRSASLGRLTDADARVLTDSFLRTVVDLRGEKERVRWPSRLDALPGVEVRFLPIDPSLGASLHDIAAAPEAAIGVMHRAYAAYAFDWAHRYADLFGLLLQETRRPLLFHCTAGKDRTGFGAALLLAALGVEWEAIRADYIATNRLWRGDPEVAASLPPAIADVLLRVHVELIDGVFAAIREAHGSLAAYLDERIGLDAARCDRLRAALID